jgi:tetratricopeptide (TPR) repeat protein
MFRRKRYLPVGWFWFLGTLVPVIGLVQVGEASMADRYAYIPLIGIFVMIAWSLADWAETKIVRTVSRVIPAMCVLAALGCATTRQMSYWESDYDMWSHSLAVEESPFAHNGVGAALMNPESAMTQHDRQNFGTDEKRIDEARRHFERALELYRQHVQQNPASSLSAMAGTLNSLGALDISQNRTDEARQYFEEALKIHRQLAERNLEPYPPYLATTLDYLGTLDRDQNRMDETRQHLEGAIEICRQLARQNPDAYLPQLAAILNYLGGVDRTENRMDEARQHAEEALQVYRQLTQQNPDAYLPDLAAILNNLGILDRNQKRIEECRAHYTEALDLYRKLAQRDPGKYAGYVASVEASLKELDGKAGPQ